MLQKRTYGTRSNYQLCPGQKCGLKYAIHTLRKKYEKTDSSEILLIDAEKPESGFEKPCKYMHIYTIRYTELIL